MHAGLSRAFLPYHARTRLINRLPCLTSAVEPRLVDVFRSISARFVRHSGHKTRNTCLVVSWRWSNEGIIFGESTVNKLEAPCEVCMIWKKLKVSGRFSARLKDELVSKLCVALLHFHNFYILFAQWVEFGQHNWLYWYHCLHLRPARKISNNYQ